MPGLMGAAGEAGAMPSRKDAPTGKPVGLSPATYSLPTSQRPTSHELPPSDFTACRSALATRPSWL
jgi:hypothetical protein